MNHGNDLPDEQDEWLAQERGMLAARGSGSIASDAMAERYRVLCEVLVSAPVAEPPADFAAAVSARIARRDAAVERVMTFVLFCALVVSIIAVAGLYGGQVLEVFRARLSADSMTALFLALGCVAITWAIRFGSEIVRDGGQASA